ncbi:MAG: phosphoribosyl-ATP diphosphatase [Thermaurantiacus tibetensis]|uniref:phosphoribosyl-ATP diphosphatase n=1 Tax=Thermaurantiacus tibetensis TaxID=2759035 RepID=UPI00188E4134|nr:phosphoribosyl-ATP diphosphatase [Thermaurantiacus tibetensis]
MSDILLRLEAVIAARRHALAREPALAEASYVARQLAKGPARLAQKLGEEAVETVVAALAEDDAALAAEAADLLFHLLLLLGGRGVPLGAVLAELERREGTSGIDERKAREA